MRGVDETSRSLFSYVDLEERISPRHPLRKMADVLLEGANGTLTGGPIVSLAPGAVDSTTFSGSYTIQQSDMDAGQVTNTATVTGTLPTGTNVSDTSGTAVDNDEPTVTPLPSTADVVLVKSSSVVDVNTNGVTDLGDRIDYSFAVTNTGNVTLSNVTLADVLLEGANGTLTGGPIVSLAPGAVDSTSFSGSYTILQSDIESAL